MVTATKIYLCPTCKKELTKEEYDYALGIVKELKEAIGKAREEGKEAGTQQYKTQVELLEKQHLTHVGRLEKTIETLKAGTTAQKVGFKDEYSLCDNLKTQFPDDDIQHKGKLGDILQVVCVEDAEIGKIVYECKNKPRIESADIRQTFLAKQYRKANHAILVTTGERKRKPFDGLGYEHDIFIVTYALVIFLVNILRSHMVDMHHSSLPENQQADANRLLANYLTQGEGRLAINAISTQANLLAEGLQDEMIKTRKWWLERWNSIQTIGIAGNSILINIQLILTGQAPELLEYHQMKSLPESTLEKQES